MICCCRAHSIVQDVGLVCNFLRCWQKCHMLLQSRRYCAGCGACVATFCTAGAIVMCWCRTDSIVRGVELVRQLSALLVRLWCAGAEQTALCGMRSLCGSSWCHRTCRTAAGPSWARALADSAASSTCLLLLKVGVAATRLMGWSGDCESISIP